MYKAMVNADVGDEQKGTDPTVNNLCERVASLLKKEAAVFLPGGVMSDLIAMLVLCARGDKVIASREAHVVTMEGGAPAAIAGVMMHALDSEKGIFTANQVSDAIATSSKRNAVRPGLVSIEQTCNRGGGSIWPLAMIREIGALARGNRVSMHMDGARLLNASVASAVPPSAYAEPFDTVWLDLSKGLGCPVGSVLAGSSDSIEMAWRWKHRLGGAMRQAGILAAAGLYALDHHIDRLEEDHANARRLAQGLANVNGLSLKWETIETNMVFINVSKSSISAPELASRLLGDGIAIGVESTTELRAVTHLDVSKRHIERIVAATARIMDAAA